MRTLSISRKANNGHYYFGEATGRGRQLIATFNSAEELHAYMTETVNLQGHIELKNVFNRYNKIIKNEYSRSATFYDRNDFLKLDYCTKIFNDLAK